MQGRLQIAMSSSSAFAPTSLPPSTVYSLHLPLGWSPFQVVAPVVLFISSIELAKLSSFHLMPSIDLVSAGSAVLRMRLVACRG